MQILQKTHNKIQKASFRVPLGIYRRLRGLSRTWNSFRLVPALVSAVLAYVVRSEVKLTGLFALFVLGPRAFPFSLNDKSENKKTDFNLRVFVIAFVYKVFIGIYIQ